MPTTDGSNGRWQIAALLVLVVGVAYLIQAILLPFVLAAILGFLGRPIVRTLETRGGWPRAAAATAAYVAIVIVLGVFFFGAARLLADELAGAARAAPDIVHGLVAQLVGRRHIEILGKPLDSQGLADRALASAQEFLTTARGLERLLGAGVGLLVGTVLTLVLTFYFLLSPERLLTGALWLVPPARRSDMRALALRVAPALVRYVRGVFVVVAYTATMAWIGYRLVFGLEHATVLSILVGFLELVPVIGPIASATLVGLVAIQQTTLAATIGVMGWAIVLRLSIDQLVGPLVLGQAVRLHPVMIIFCFLVGGVLLGVLGMILAIPVAVTIKVALSLAYGERPD
jgi:predicted PurR-regulated permease PerM